MIRCCALSITTFPDGGQTTISYLSPAQTVVQSKIDTSGRLTYATTLLDGLGRVKRTAAANAEATPYDVQDICYDLNGRVQYQSYPYQAASTTVAQNCSGSGDSIAYDGAGRPTSVTHADGSTVATSYAARATQTTDEGIGNGVDHVKRVEQTDAFGRLTAVCEVYSGAALSGLRWNTRRLPGLDIAATGFLTTYSYDLLNNLKVVAQGTLITGHSAMTVCRA